MAAVPHTMVTMPPAFFLRNALSGVCHWTKLFSNLPLFSQEIFQGPGGFHEQRITTIFS